MAKRKKTHVEGELLQELIEDAYSDFTAAISAARQQIETVYPQMVFQERHTSGWLWKKRTWYTYYRYFEGSMVAISSYGHATVTTLETK